MKKQAISKFDEFDPEHRKSWDFQLDSNSAATLKMLKDAGLLDKDAYIQLYQKWASYEPEEEGIVIAYSSVYGNTQKAVLFLEEVLRKHGCQQIVMYDLARSDMSTVVAQAFRFNKLVLATTTYNGGMFPAMREFINHLTEREFQNRTLALIENGSWASMAGKLMRDKFEKSKNIRFVEPFVKITSVMDEANKKELRMLAEELRK